MTAKLDVDGLDPFRKGIAEAAAGLPAVLEEVFDEAADLLVRDVRRLQPRRTGRLAASVRSSGGAVTLGVGIPYAGWIEFGGAVGRKGAVKRRYVRSGRTLYPATRSHWAAVQGVAEDGIDRLSANSGLL